MWKELLEVKTKFNIGDWIVGGDFNSVSCSQERKGVSIGGRRGEILEFKSFIDELGCIDIPCEGDFQLV